MFGNAHRGHTFLGNERAITRYTPLITTGHIHTQTCFSITTTITESMPDHVTINHVTKTGEINQATAKYVVTWECVDEVEKKKLDFSMANFEYDKYRPSILCMHHIIKECSLGFKTQTKSMCGKLMLDLDRKRSCTYVFYNFSFFVKNKETNTWERRSLYLTED